MSLNLFPAQHWALVSLGPAAFICNGWGKGSGATPIKTQDSELSGQESAKQIAKNKMCNELLCVFFTSKHFRDMMS